MRTHFPNTPLDHIRDRIITAGETLLPINRVFGFKYILGPATQVDELLVALLAQDPIKGDFSEAYWAAHALERPVVVHVG